MTVCIPSIFVLQTERAMSRCNLSRDIFVLSSLRASVCLHGLTASKPYAWRF